MDSFLNFDTPPFISCNAIHYFRPFLSLFVVLT